MLNWTCWLLTAQTPPSLSSSLLLLPLSSPNEESIENQLRACFNGISCTAQCHQHRQQIRQWQQQQFLLSLCLFRPSSASLLQMQRISRKKGRLDKSATHFRLLLKQACLSHAGTIQTHPRTLSHPHSTYTLHMHLSVHSGQLQKHLNRALDWRSRSEACWKACKWN